jgi:hypothetical protein
MLTHYCSVDPKGWIWRWGGYRQAYVAQLLLSAIDIRDVIEAEMFHRPQLSSAAAAVAAAAAAEAAKAASCAGVSSTVAVAAAAASPGKCGIATAAASAMGLAQPVSPHVVAMLLSQRTAACL